MKMKKMSISLVIILIVITMLQSIILAQDISYIVQSNDSFYTISSKHGITLDSLLRANNATSKTVLYPGQRITIPLGDQLVHTAKSGDTYWTISQDYNVDFSKLLQVNNATVNSRLSVGSKVIIPSTKEQAFTHTVKSGETFYTISKYYNVNLDELLHLNYANMNTQLYPGQIIKIPDYSTQPSTPTKPYITYKNYTIVSGDTIWSVANKFGIPTAELMQVNNLNEQSSLTIGRILKIPVHVVPIKPTTGPGYGELLDWWTEAQYVVPRGANFEIVDFYTGKSFFARRTAGANHADCETLTVADTNKMKEVWGGAFSWARRPVIIKIDGRKIAAGMSAMPHAGNDYDAGGVWTSWRSDGYGPGINYDFIKNNGADGHFDIHFFNSTRHFDGQLDQGHQAAIKISSGIN